eukprot:CAMPEP_0172911674 /NCGR_PEP_ID=MMETSP1075-20121228/187003_1 /TAXON_ID=2916 /ORGANISM="Ceratium fusus, Strain PA161109" /LENGTH=131 /DNA_ID=CAMNT_0013770041 /DNA_START=216 /DNA_END=607 /DNA_ORIENTATION=-
MSYCTQYLCTRWYITKCSGAASSEGCKSGAPPPLTVPALSVCHSSRTHVEALLNFLPGGAERDLEEDAEFEPSWAPLSGSPLLLMYGTRSMSLQADCSNSDANLRALSSCFNDGTGNLVLRVKRCTLAACA